MFNCARFAQLCGHPLVARCALGSFLVLGTLMAVWLAVKDVAETTGVRRGDFPAFWTLAVIAAGDEPNRLYDIELQRKVQNSTWPALAGGVLPAAYPPYVAYVLQPMARLDHRVARQLWTTLSLMASCISVLLLVRVNSLRLWPVWMVWALLFLFSPTLRGVVGGQLMSVVVLLVALCTTFIRRQSCIGDLLLGAALGALLCKPYYALAALVIPILQRRWLAVASFVVIALGWAGCAAAVLGRKWLVEWGAFAASFAKINLETNAHQMPNLWAQLYRLYGGTKNFGISGWVLTVGAYVLLALGVYLLIGATAVRSLLGNLQRHGDTLLYLIISLVIVSMPQVNFYDLGVVACAAVALFNSERLFDRFVVTGCILLSQFAVAPPFGLPVHFIIALIGLGYVCVRVRERVMGEL